MLTYSHKGQALAYSSLIKKCPDFRGRRDGRSVCHNAVGLSRVSPCRRTLATVSSHCLAAGFRALKSGIARPARECFLTYPTPFSTRPFSFPLPTLHGVMVKP